jgi:tRNA pseudouridine13 synthase
MSVIEVLAGLPLAFGGPPARGVIRAAPEDFVVEEVTGIEPSGAGEHVWLVVRKRGANTQWVAQRLARLAGVPPVAIGYAGLKDRHALTTQCFTVHLPGRPEPDWSALADGEIEVLSATRHHRKLQRGALRGNRFRLTVRDLAGDGGALAQRLAQIGRVGVPNYFGEQRFGRDAANLAAADALLRGTRRPRQEQGLLLSAARSHLFNAVLGARVEGGSWDHVLAGDVMQLDGRSALFRADSPEEDTVARAARLEIHPTGPLPGRRGRALEAAADVARIERDALAPHRDWVEGLARLGVEADRRALRLPVRELSWEAAPDVLRLSFFLPAGGYATMVLRECAAVSAGPVEAA